MVRARIAWVACALLGAAGPSVPSVAQELSEHEFLADYPTVLSASRLRQDASETPQAVTVIDQAMIRASGAREFAELFRLVPGFTVSYVTYVKGLQPIVSYHGLGREFFSRLQVLIDGRSINNATLGGVEIRLHVFEQNAVVAAQSGTFLLNTCLVEIVQARRFGARGPQYVDHDPEQVPVDKRQFFSTHH